MLYEPQEDSELLKAQVIRLARGDVLDVGTGSGIQAAAAASRDEVEHVLAIDIDDGSLEYARSRNAHAKIAYVRSDLFSGVAPYALFDTIICNPPYLPAEEDDEHAALYGGALGHEFTAKFLREAKGHLRPGGIILLLVSSSSREGVLRAIMSEGYSHARLAREAHFFEVLDVLLLTSPFGKGKRGEVHLEERDGRTVLVKQRSARSAVDTIANEAAFLPRLNAHGIGPAFIAYADGRLVREFVDGIELRDWLPSANRADAMRVLRSILEQCRTMDTLGIEKSELTRPWKDILVRPEAVPVLIDFERCREIGSPKNVTQCGQFLSGSRMREILAGKGVVLPKAEAVAAMRAYKQALRSHDETGQNAAYAKLLSLLPIVT